MEENNTNGKKEITKEDALKLISDDNKLRANMCQNDINEALKKHNCVFDISMVINSRGASPMVNIIPQKPTGD